MTPGRDNPGAYRDLVTGRGWKGGKPDRGRQSRLARVTTLGRMVWEGSAYERWRPAGRSAVQVIVISVIRRERGGCVQIERESVSTGKIWGEIEDRSEGKEKQNG